MLPATREFLNIILEQESGKKSQKGKGNKKEPNKPEAGKDDKGNKPSEDDTSSIQVLDAEVSNKLSL